MPDCTHWWVLESSTEPEVLGTCKHCGQTKMHRQKFAMSREDLASIAVIKDPLVRRTNVDAKETYVW